MLINTQHIKAAIQCAATKDIRYYLNGVHIERTQAGDVHIVSTDGHVIFAGLVPAEHVQDAKPGPWRLTIPLDVVKQATKTRDHCLMLDLRTDAPLLLGNIQFSPIDGVFPDWRRVLPSWSDVNAREQSPSLINPSLLVRARDALAAWYGSKKDSVFMLRQSGDAIAIMEGRDCFAFAGIMPMRADKTVRADHFTPAAFETKE